MQGFLSSVLKESVATYEILPDSNRKVTMVQIGSPYLNLPAQNQLFLCKFVIMLIYL